TAQKLEGLILQAQLARLGLTLKIQEVAPATFNGIFFGSEPPGKRPNLLAWFWWPDYNDPYDMAVVMLASNSTGPAGANAGYNHNKHVDDLLAQLKCDGREKQRNDTRRLQDVRTRVDPAMILTDEPAQVSILAHTLHGYVFSPLDLQTFDFY